MINQKFGNEIYQFGNGKKRLALLYFKNTIWKNIAVENDLALLLVFNTFLNWLK